MSEESLFETSENVIVQQKDKVGVVQINRPKALNALNSQTMAELRDTSDFICLEKTDKCLMLVRVSIC